MNEDKKEDNNLSDDYGKYNPSKKEREIRRRVYQRWLEVRDDPQRKQAEKDWDEAQKQYRMYVPEIDPDDWRSTGPDGPSRGPDHPQHRGGRRLHPGADAPPAPGAVSHAPGSLSP